MFRTLVIALMGSCSLVHAALSPAVPQTPDELGDRFDRALSQANDRIAAIIAVPDDQRTFENTILAMDDISAHFDRDGSLMAFMGHVHPDAAMRDAARSREEAWMNWSIDLGKNEALYSAIKSYADTNPQLDGEHARLLQFILRDYRRAGMGLTPEARLELTSIEKQMNLLSIEFDQNILNDTTTLFLTEEEVAGMPADYIAGLTRAGDMYALGMDYPTSIPILDHSPNEGTRQKMWLSRRRRAKANVDVLEKLLVLRARQANLLGFDHASDFENEIRMSKNAATVESFYAQLRPLLAEKAAEDLALLTEAKQDATGDTTATIRPWDFGYWQERVRERDYNVDSNAIKAYFPFHRVRDGLFKITQDLYGIDYRPINPQPMRPCGTKTLSTSRSLTAGRAIRSVSSIWICIHAKTSLGTPRSGALCPERCGATEAFRSPSPRSCATFPNQPMIVPAYSVTIRPRLSSMSSVTACTRY